MAHKNEFGAFLGGPCFDGMCREQVGGTSAYCTAPPGHKGPHRVSMADYDALEVLRNVKEGQEPPAGPRVHVHPSAGCDGAWVVQVDTDFEPDGSDGGPGLRVLVNDDDAYVGVPFDVPRNVKEGQASGETEIIRASAHEPLCALQDEHWGPCIAENGDAL